MQIVESDVLDPDVTINYKSDSDKLKMNMELTQRGVEKEKKPKFI